MGKLVKVDFGKDEKSYGSFEEAINSARDMGDFESLNGARLSSYIFADDKVILQFENDLNLLVYCDSNRIDWKVVDGVDIKMSINYGTDFELPNGAIFKWDWKETLDSFISKPVFFSPSEQFLFLSYPNSEEYIFGFVVDADNPLKKFLYISEA